MILYVYAYPIYYYPLYSTPIRHLHRLKNVLWYRKTLVFLEHKGTRIFLICKGWLKKNMNQSIFLNNVVDLVNEIATFLHNFLLFLTPDPSKQLTICVFAGLTRNLILFLSNATRCVPTPLIGWKTVFHGHCSTVEIGSFRKHSQYHC